MELIDLPMDRLRHAPWNPNTMDDSMFAKLRHSLISYGMVQNLVVRPLGDGNYEVLSGNQRLQVLQEIGRSTAPCFVIELNDAHARVLSQALNRIEGEDDLGLRAELLQEVLTSLPQEDVLSLLPETTDSLKAMATLGQQSMAEHLQAWQKAQAVRLKHLQFQLTSPQLDVVMRALDRLLPHISAGDDGNPNRRGLALYRLCLAFLDRSPLP